MEKEIIQIKVGDENYPTNCYIIKDNNNNEGVLIDPGVDAKKIINIIKEKNVNIKKVILTHCHGDHIGALDEVKDFTKAEVLIHEKDIDGVEDNEKNYCEYLNIPMQKISKNQMIALKEKDVVKVGNISLEVYHTPGHTNGCICLYEKDLKALFTGDTLFYNCYGRCDLKSGSTEDMKKSLDTLFDTFNDITIYPGHEDVVNIDTVKRRVRLLFKIKNG